MPQNLTEKEWESVSEYVEILEPLKEATVLMSGDTYPGLSQYIPVIETLKKAAVTHDTEMEIDEENSNENALVRSLCVALQQRFAFAATHNDPMVFAMILDPRYKDRFIPSATEKHDVIKRLKWKVQLLYDNRVAIASEEKETSRRNPEGILFFKT